MRITKLSLSILLLLSAFSGYSLEHCPKHHPTNKKHQDIKNTKNIQAESPENEADIMNRAWAKQDWANLNRFKQENAELKKQDSTTNKVVFMGNSITEGWIKQRPEFFSNNPYINRGISGQTTPQMLIRFRQDVIELKPTAVVILAGTNDIAGNTGYSTTDMTVGNIISMAELAKANNIKVILCSVLPAKEFHWRKELKPAKKIIELNSKLKAYADKHHIIYVDYYTYMVNKSKGLRDDLCDDGVHPNVKGYKIMEPLILKAIHKTLR